MALRRAFIAASAAVATAQPRPRFAVRAVATAGQLVESSYDAATGVFRNEDLWQSGNTLEGLANLMIASPSALTNYSSLFANTFALTPVIVVRGTQRVIVWAIT